jgi:hypothetical protein
MRRLSPNTIRMNRRTLATGAAAFALASIASGSKVAADPLTSEQFRDEVIDVLRRNHPSWRIETPIDPAALVVDHKSIYLTNLYQGVSRSTRQK